MLWLSWEWLCYIEHNMQYKPFLVYQSHMRVSILEYVTPYDCIERQLLYNHKHYTEKTFLSNIVKQPTEFDDIFIVLYKLMLLHNGPTDPSSLK